MFEENFFSLSPVNFFEISLKVPKISSDTWKEEITHKKTRLPDTSWLLGERQPPDIHLGWSEEGLYLFAHIAGRFDQPVFPHLTEGDSFEVFIDTRDRKQGSFNTKFCHHFYFLPQAVDGHMKGEITRFRTEDAHPLANPEEIELEVHASPLEGKLKIFLPASLLTGWNPAEFDRLGFSWRLNHRFSAPQHFSAKTDEYTHEQEPSLWTSCKVY